MTKEQYNKELIEEGWNELTPEYLEAKRLEAIERDKARNRRNNMTRSERIFKIYYDVTACHIQCEADSRELNSEHGKIAKLMLEHTRGRAEAFKLVSDLLRKALED